MKNKFLSQKWVVARAKQLGLRVINLAGGTTHIMRRDGYSCDASVFTREAWQQMEDSQTDLLKANSIPVPKPATTEPRLERETDHLTAEEHANLVADDMSLRGGFKQLEGSLFKFKGQLMRKNAILDHKKIDAILEEHQAILQEIIDLRKKRAS